MFLLCQVLVATALQVPPGGDAIMLRHRFPASGSESYSVVRTVTGEMQGGDFVSWVPFKIVYSETYTLKVLSLAPAGTADIRYEQRMKTHVAQWGPNPPEDTDTGKDWAVMTLSPTNQILKIHDYKKPPKKKGGEKEPQEPDDQPPDEGGLITRPTPRQDSPLTNYLFSAMMEAVQFSQMFDFGPKLPYYPVKVGDTWLDTISAMPGQAAGSGASSRTPANTRLDITYRYDGIKERNKKKVWAIHGSYSADLDMKPRLLFGAPQFVLQLNPIKSATTKVKGEVDFFLDSKTGSMVYAEATSSGDALIDAPEQFTMLRTALKLNGNAVAKPIPTPASTSKPKGK